MDVHSAHEPVLEFLGQRNLEDCMYERSNTVGMGPTITKTGDHCGERIRATGTDKPLTNLLRTLDRLRLME